MTNNNELTDDITTRFAILAAPTGEPVLRDLAEHFDYPFISVTGARLGASLIGAGRGAEFFRSPSAINAYHASAVLAVISD